MGTKGSNQDRSRNVYRNKDVAYFAAEVTLCATEKYEIVEGASRCGLL